MSLIAQLISHCTSIAEVNETREWLTKAQPASFTSDVSSFCTVVQVIL